MEMSSNYFKKVWVLNGACDYGWTPEVFSTKEKAIKAFNAYVAEYKEYFGNEPEELDEEMCRFDTENAYVTFWIDEMEVK